MPPAKPYLAKSLLTFRNSIDKAFPKRDKSSDGWIGDSAHASRKSEHNPDAKGCVHAIDVDIDDGDPGRDLRALILTTAIGHKAVWYVISNGLIYSRTYGWKPRKYTGPNAHTKHVHISIQLTKDAENDTSLVLNVNQNAPWGALYGGLPGTRKIGLWSRGNDVRELQRVLNAWYPKRKQLTVDGEFGKATYEMVKYAQLNSGITPDGIVGPRTWEKLGFEDRIPQ